MLVDGKENLRLFMGPMSLYVLDLDIAETSFTLINQCIDSSKNRPVVGLYVQNVIILYIERESNIPFKLIYS